MDIAQHVADGLTTAQIAKKAKCHVETVRRYMRKRGIRAKRKPRGGQLSNRARVVRMLRAAGGNQSELARTLKVTRQAVNFAMKRLGLLPG